MIPCIFTGLVRRRKRGTLMAQYRVPVNADKLDGPWVQRWMRVSRRVEPGVMCFR